MPEHSPQKEITPSLVYSYKYYHPYSFFLFSLWFFIYKEVLKSSFHDQEEIPKISNMIILWDYVCGLKWEFFNTQMFIKYHYPIKFYLWTFLLAQVDTWLLEAFILFPSYFCKKHNSPLVIIFVHSLEINLSQYHLLLHQTLLLTSLHKKSCSVSAMHIYKVVHSLINAIQL